MTTGESYRKNPDFVHRSVGGEELLVPVRRTGADLSCIYLLDEIGGWVWRELENPATCERLVDRVLEEYDVDRETAAADIGRFLEELRSIEAVLAEPAR